MMKGVAMKTEMLCPKSGEHKSNANIHLLRGEDGTLFCPVHGDQTWWLIADTSDWNRVVDPLMFVEAATPREALTKYAEGEGFAGYAEVSEDDGVYVMASGMTGAVFTNYEIFAHPTKVEPHNCDDHPRYEEWDGPLGHGYVCGVCGRLLQVG